jgi:hypothetical protein
MALVGHPMFPTQPNALERSNTMMTHKQYELIAALIGKFEGELQHEHDIRTKDMENAPSHYDDPAFKAVSDLSIKLMMAFGEENSRYPDDKFITALVDAQQIRYWGLWNKQHDLELDASHTPAI